MASNLNLLYIGDCPEYFGDLKESNISFNHVENSAKAIKYLSSSATVSAIICQYNLPGNNGLFLFDEIKKLKVNDNVPFILLSNEFKEDVYKQAFTKQVDDFYVTSVASSNAILSRIQFLVNQKQNLKSNSTIETEKNVEEATVYKMPLSKRIFDIFVASSVLLLASPFLLLIIAAIRLESKGKVYYTSKRVGRKTFDFYKLRSMRTGSDELLRKLAKEKNQYKTEVKEENDVNASCPRCNKLPEGQFCSTVMYLDANKICDYWYSIKKAEALKNNSTFVKIVNDPRVTKVGKFIRNTSIDELPQLINVLKGDMSIVGNRPLPVYEAEQLTEDALSTRFLGPPGITGLWQVELRGKGGNMSEEERMRLDNEYACHFKGGNYSFWYDMKLILRTIPALLQKDSV